MSWDFSTEPEFEEQLRWMREYVRKEICPVEPIAEEVGNDDLERIFESLRPSVRERGLWAAHLPPELGGQGFGQVKLGLMNEVLGACIYAPYVFGCQAPDSGNSEILALAGTPEQKERWLHPLLNGELRSAFSMTEPETPGSDPTQLRSRAARSIVESALQVFGGIGFTWEHDLHLFLRRVLACEQRFGDALFHERQLAAALASRAEDRLSASSGRRFR